MEPSFLVNAITWAVPLVLAITLHEAAHGFVAYTLGDPTAYERGRVTFNPFRHIDLFGTILLPAFFLLTHSPVMFGYAKPVPVDFNRLHHLRRDTFLVAIAGPGINVLLATLCALALHLDIWVKPEDAAWLYLLLYRGIMVNLVLAVFNMLPILPLDGGRVLSSLLSDRWRWHYMRSERKGMVIVLALFLLPPLLAQLFHIDIPLGEWLITNPAMWLAEWLLKLTGNGI